MGNIQLEGGSIGPTGGRDNIRARELHIADLRSAIIDLLYDLATSLYMTRNDYMYGHL